MNDPHVAALFYRIEHSTAFNYANAEPFGDDLPEFRIRIEDGEAIVEPKRHFATAEEAMKVVEPVLRAWELDAALTHGGKVLDFVYQHAAVVDRNLPPGSGVGFAAGRSMVHAVGVAVLRQYPAPPSDGLVVEPRSKVTAMLDMWLQYKAGEGRLADTANFCQTALEKGRQRSAAAKKYGIELPVLTTLGELAAEKGGSHARKHKGYDKPYTEIERAWLDAVLKKLIRRAAQVAHDPRANRPLITMADPDLPRL